ncbi:tail fiber protein [Paenibacillus wulumuqiensis]|uniref:tail fiber protein n=1 Tax=Paenibacillus wulumuqiensis TaxID=1567107 RepID=UPI0006967C55|nr:tail fiber protein [Paenibacillus wulumuqiensis]
MIKQKLGLLSKVCIVMMLLFCSGGLLNPSTLIQQASAGGAEPYLGEIRLFPYPSAPEGWTYAAGQNLSIQTNTALFALIGTNFGGNGQTTFALPDLRAKAPAGMGYYIAMQGAFPSRDEGMHGIGNALLSEVRLFPYNFAPTGWIPAKGQLLSISSYPELYARIGLTFGGDGKNTFQLPNLPDPQDNVHYLISTDPTYYNHVTGMEYLGGLLPFAVPVTVDSLVQANGSLLSIADNQALYSLLGNHFGGDGTNNFGLPNPNGSQAELIYYVSLGGIYPSFEGISPAAQNDNYSTSKNQVLTVSESGVLGNDSNAAGAFLVNSTTHGTVMLSNSGAFRYVPHTDYVGTDSFTYGASNSYGSSLATVTITVNETAPPVVSGVQNDGIYNTAVTPSFTSGTAVLNGQPYTSGTAITAEGTYTLNVTNNIGTTSVRFTIDRTPPVVTGVTYGQMYTTGPVITFNEGTAVLDGHPFVSGSAVNAEGSHLLVVTDPAGNVSTVAFSMYLPRTVTFDSQGGSPAAEQTVNYGAYAVQPPAPTKTGYTFGGWYVDTSFTVPFEFNHTAVTGNLTVYARWTVNSHTVRFDTYGGSAVADMAVISGEKAMQPTAPSRTGYLFAGWYTDSARTQPFDFNLTPITGDLMLYAKWVTEAYTVTFNTYGGTDVQDVFVEYGGTLAEPAQPVKNGYRFDGWYTDGALSERFRFGVTPLTGNLTLYAGWQLNPVTDDDDDDRPAGSPITASSTNGQLTLPIGRAGEVSIGSGIRLQIPAHAAAEELKISINRLADSDTQGLWTSGIKPVSPVYELLKNVSRNFNVPVTLTLTFDPSGLTGSQTPGIYYLNESTGVWTLVEGSRMSGNQITAQVDHFTKFAVLAADTNTSTVTPQPTTGSDTAADAAPVTLSDIGGHWAEKSIRQAVDAGIVRGYADGSFKPGQAVTRAEFAVMLLQAMGLPGSETPLAFTDKETIGSWARPAIAEAVRQGWVQGNADGSFRPNDRITRAEMAVMAAAALHSDVMSQPKTTFTDDKKIPAWARGAVAAMQQTGIINGKSANTFDPAGQTTRAEAVKVIMMIRAMRSS